MRKLKWLVPAFAALCWLNSAQAALISFDNLNENIPDNGGISGLADTRSVSLSFDQTANVDVLLNIQGTGFGAFNGDLYVSLEHDGTFAVLMNGVGRTATDPLGYGDNGVNIRLTDNGSMGDIHQYRLALFGNASTGIAGSAGALTGTWAPDGRNVDPDVVTDASARTALLSSFVNGDPNGAWTLFIADTEMGGTEQLVSWGLDITAVPEPESVGIAAGLAGCLVAGGRALHRRLTRR